jgi:multicomponent Na+:H+ antiporter subunit D
MSLGKGMIEDAAASAGFGWLTAVLVLASVLTGAAVLRACGKVFLGLGEPNEDEAARAGTEEQPESQRTGRTPLVMLLPACLLMALGLGVGLIPSLGDRVELDAARFLDQAGYSQLVLDHAPVLSPVGDREPAGPNASQVALGLLSTFGALVLAFAAIYRHQFPRAVCRFGATVLEPPLQRIRGLQSGDVRDYVTWLTFGVAGLGAAFALLVR